MLLTKTNKMKKVFFVCMSVGILATSCNLFESKTEQPEIVEETTVEVDSSITTTTDSIVPKVDSAKTAVEQKKDAKK